MQRMDSSEEHTCGLCELDLNFNRKTERGKFQLGEWH